MLSPVLRPVEDSKVKGVGSQHARSCPPGARCTSFSGLWSMEWLQSQPHGKGQRMGKETRGARGPQKEESGWPSAPLDL
jgi:hypothetical protein